MFGREPETDLVDVLAVVAESGVRGVEVMANLRPRAAELARLCAYRDLEVCGVHVFWAELDDPDGVLDYCVNSEASRLLVTALWTRHERDMAERLRGLRRISESARKRDISVLVHNHAEECLRGRDGRSLLERIMTEPELEDVGIALDLYWTTIGSPDPLELARRVRGRCRYIHAKDGRAGAADGVSIGLGEGEVEIRTLMFAALRPDTEWVVIERDIPAPDYHAALRADREYLLSLRSSAGERVEGSW
jgi:sugar phosphate isomerase/epimerase